MQRPPRALLLALLAAIPACIERPLATVRPRTESGILMTIPNTGVDKVDLIVMVDNSNSMAQNQANITAQFGALIETLTNPKCTSAAMPDPHVCDLSNPQDQRVHEPVKDLHVAVVDSDLGTPGATGLCAEPETGDDGLINPIRFGPAIQHHLPWNPPPSTCGINTSIPADGSFRPTDCTDPMQFPEWIGFQSMDATPETRSAFVHDFRCNAALYVCGCGLEQQIESVWRALIWHGASGTLYPGGDLANGGDTPFLRSDALLAIVMLTDEEDGSVQNCAYAEPGQPCEDKTGVYRRDWSSEGNVNDKFYLYQPGGALDPTWPIDRYYDPTNLARGFLGLKPHHPERVVFAAITGVPLEVPRHTVDNHSEIDWDALLGAPGGAGPDDFYSRDESQSIRGNQSGGEPFTMQTGRPAQCPAALNAACYRPTGTQTYDPNQPCDSTIYRAFPSRRVVELARRFDQSPVCGDHEPCHNGLVESICADNYTAAMQNVVDKIQNHIGDPCLSRPLVTHRDEGNFIAVDCKIVESEPTENFDCTTVPGRRPSLDEQGNPAVITDETGRHTLCEVVQVPTYPADSTAGAPGTPVSGRSGWFYSSMPRGNCSQRVSFTDDARPSAGTTTQLECIQSVTGVDAGADGG